MPTTRTQEFRASKNHSSRLFLNRKSDKPKRRSNKKQQPRREPLPASAKKKGRDYERAFFCCKRALAHALTKNHKLKIECDGCKEIIGFLEIPGYSGDKHNPIAVDFDRPY